MSDRLTWLSDAPLVIAHRGASLLAPENTMASFRLAMELCADAIEFDVKLSGDGVPVVHHDARLDRTTNGRGRVKDHTLAELKALDAGLKFADQFEGEQIPTLKEVLEEFLSKLLLNIELTNYSDPLDDLPERVSLLIRGDMAQDRILISSFNPVALRSIKRLKPGVRTALLLQPGSPPLLLWLLRKMTPHEDLHPHYRMVTRKLIEDVQSAGGRVNTWTVNEYDQLCGLFAMGAQGIITDDVENALRARREVFGT